MAGASRHPVRSLVLHSRRRGRQRRALDQVARVRSRAFLRDVVDVELLLCIAIGVREGAHSRVPMMMVMLVDGLF